MRRDRTPSKFIPVDPVRPVTLRDLAEGNGFTLWVGDYPDPEVIGVLLRKAGKGYARVQVRYPGERLEEFKDSKGEIHSFNSHKVETTEWSLGTFVIKGENAMSTSATKVDEVDGKGKVLKSKIVPGKSKVAKTGAKAKVAKTADNDCLDGCGEKVFNRFKPGHDARFYSSLKKFVAGDVKFGDLPKITQKEVGDLKGAKKALADHFKPKKEEE